MATLIRNLLTVYGPQAEADRFIGRFVRGGMEAFVPIPPTANPAHKYSETWGACPDGYDVEILTCDSIAAVEFRTKGEEHSRPRIKSVDTNWLNYNTFTLADQHKWITARNLPGFLGQFKTPVALIVFHSDWTFPNRWIEQVINAEYERGIAFHMQSYDVLVNAEMYMPGYGDPCDHFHSYTSAVDSKHIQSGHCAILITVESSPISEFNDMDYGDDDPTLPTIDDDGNEIPDEFIVPMLPVNQ